MNAHLDLAGAARRAQLDLADAARRAHLDLAGAARRAHLDLAGAARRVGLTLTTAELAGLDDHARLSAIATWRGRMINEHVSARVFASLERQLARAGRPTDARAAARMVGDEHRHAELCAAVVEALGGAPAAELPELPAVPEHADADPLEAVLRNVLSISCLSETVAVALIDAERRAAGPPALATLLAQIVADEVQHARSGWRLLEDCAPRLGPDLRARLDDYLVLAFAHLVEHELAHLPARPAPSPAAEAIGVCDGLGARQLFFATVEQVIVPGLQAHGLDALTAWRAARRLGA